MADKYDQLCECALICMTPSDVKQLERCSPEYEENWKRVKVNSGARTVMPMADCEICDGQGYKPDQAA